METPSKAALRQQIQQAIAALSSTARVSRSSELCSILRQQAIWCGANFIFGFAPLPNEPDIMPLLTEALTAGKRVTLPCYDAGERTYSARAIRDLSQVSVGSFGVLEPNAGCPVIPLN